MESCLIAPTIPGFPLPLPLCWGRCFFMIKRSEWFLTPYLSGSEGKKNSNQLSNCRQCSSRMDMILADVSCFYIFWLCQLHTSHQGPEINFKLILFRQEVRIVGLLSSSESWSPPSGDYGYHAAHRVRSAQNTVRKWLVTTLCHANVLHRGQWEKGRAEYATLWKSRWGPKKSFTFVHLAIIYMKIYKVIYPFNG